MPVLFLHGKYDHVCQTVATNLAEPMREYCSDLTEFTLDTGHWMARKLPRSKCSISGVASSVRPRRLAEINERRLGALERFRNRALSTTRAAANSPIGRSPLRNQTQAASKTTFSAGR